MMLSRLQGNLVHDFGFGGRKETSLKLVESFVPTFWFKQIRVSGDGLRVLRAHPNKWQVGCRGLMVCYQGALVILFVEVDNMTGLPP